ncbi:chorismate pyruvate-lyase family protein [Micromonospora sp. CB01531]|uniref:chorismate pyruvate-lyase family protein n=1 Tax=Micromonospora sp. CB01531 TaxID=1718947 RepID=UPI0013015CFE
MFLSADGTTTGLIEAWTGEKLVADVRQQARATSAESALWPLEEPGGPLLARYVRLCGATSGRAWLYGRSLLDLTALPVQMREEILFDMMPLGRSLVRHRVETFRTLQSVDCTAPPSAEFGGTPINLPCRTVLIQAGGVCAAVITEWFDSDRLFALAIPAH